MGVGPGAYNETVTIPGYVRLVGSGAEDTTIDAGGSGSPVTFDGVVQAEVKAAKLARENREQTGRTRRGRCAK